MMYRQTEKAVLEHKEKEMFENKKDELPLNKAAFLSKLRSKIWQTLRAQR